MTVPLSALKRTKKAGKRKLPRSAEPSAVSSPAGGDDDDFAQLAVEEVSDQEELDQSEVQAAQLEDSKQAPAVSQPTQKARKKKRRKGNAAFQDAQAAAADVAQSNSDEQARWLWDSYKNAVGESFLEQEALTGETILQLSGHGSLEEQVQAAMPDWQQAFCNTAGCAPGHPKCLLISPAALGAIAMIKSFPTFNQGETSPSLTPVGRKRDKALWVHAVYANMALLITHDANSCGSTGFCFLKGTSESPSSCVSLHQVWPVGPSWQKLLKSKEYQPIFRQQACRIAKLFAKHIKVAEQQQYLQQHPLAVAAGTPNRLCKLADTEALQLSQLQLIVLDVQQDAKQRTILDLPETKRDFWTLFSRHCQQRLQTGLTKICLVNRSRSDK